jgi:hypothetical protein
MALAAASLVAGVAVVSGASPAGATTPVNCQVDPSTNIPAQYPAARTYADLLRNGGCQIIWDYIVDRLIGTTYTPVSGFRIIWESSGPPGWKVGPDLHLNYVFLQNQYNTYSQQDWGVAYHEITHIAQDWPPGSSDIWWVMEGLADWVRTDQHQWLNHVPTCSGGKHYVDGYECAGLFLGWIDAHYGSGPHTVIPLLNGAYHYGSPNSPATNLQSLTGQTIDQLWSGCLAADCAGAGPPPDKVNPSWRGDHVENREAAPTEGGKR